MREGRRHWGLATVGSTVGALFILSACAVGPSIPSPGTTVTPATPTATSDATSPSPSVEAACEEPFTHLVPSEAAHVVPATPVHVRLEGFPPNTAVTMSVVPSSDAPPGTPIGASTTDEHGAGLLSGVIPADGPYGDASIWVLTPEGCGAPATVFLVGSLEGISIDDDTVAPGQMVTITAGGFAPDGEVGLYLDSDPRDLVAPVAARFLLGARADARGAVVMRVQIPRDVANGPHYLLLNGWSFDELNDLGLVVQVTVG